MPRRRLPQRRPGPGPTPRTRRSSENGRGSGKGVGPVHEIDWTAVVRVVVLLVVAAGVATFLFYPDISRLLEHWRNASRDSTQNEADRHVRSEPHNLHTEEGGKRRQADDTRSAKTQTDKPASQGNGKKSETSVKDKLQTGGTKPNARESTIVGKSGVSGDLTEDEEEEDTEEVELMEEEEPAVFVDIGGEDEEEEEEEEEEEIEIQPPSDSLRGKGKTGDGRRGQDSMSQEEPIVLTDGQPITFTPVGSGDESILHFGGRPKEDKLKAKSDKNRETDKTVSPNSSKNKTPKSKTPTSSKPDSRKSQESKTSTNKSSKASQASSRKASTRKTADDPKVPDDLPEEVRNFKPTYLKTLTAKKIFADGRRIPPVELIPQKETNSSVRVFLFNEFLSEAECDGLKRVHDKHVEETSLPPLLCFDSLSTLRKHLQEVNKKIKVTPNDFMKGTRCVNATFSRTLSEWLSGNWSYSTAFYPGESRFSTIFEERVNRAMGLDPRNGGKFQITSYPTGKAYKAHTDCVLDSADKRDRVATVLVYLDDVSDGGETKFPDLGIWVKPRKGRALVWNNMSPDGKCEPHSLHVASKVNAGSKYILIRWYYYKSFYSLGKRPPEPSIPPRAAGTPRVSCDDYDNGSCRWYDEWNNDHLLEYELQKYTLI